MPMLSRFFICLLLFASLPGLSSAAPPPPDVTAQVDRLIEGAMSRGVIAGGVVLIGNETETLFEHAYGKTSLTPDAAPVRPDTIFDLASLTKVTATTPAILKLAEEGRLSLVDPVTRWLPEFAGKGTGARGVELHEQHQDLGLTRGQIRPGRTRLDREVSDEPRAAPPRAPGAEAGPGRVPLREAPRPVH